jgi:hypothetical protein
MDLAKAKWQMAIIGYRYYVTTGGALIRRPQKYHILNFSLPLKRAPSEIQLDFTVIPPPIHILLAFLQLRTSS